MLLIVVVTYVSIGKIAEKAPAERSCSQTAARSVLIPAKS
jgi:hypothetical protein